MIRASLVVAATLVGASFAAGAPLAQAPAAPDFKPILAGKKFVAPIKGPADLEFVKPVTKREKDTVIDTIVVRNVSAAPIARLTVDAIYYDKGGAVISTGKGTINGLLQPGEVQTVKVNTPFNARMNSSNYKFTHANGPVTPKKVDKIDDPNAKEEEKTAKAAPKKK